MEGGGCRDRVKGGGNGVGRRVGDHACVLGASLVVGGGGAGFEVIGAEAVEGRDLGTSGVRVLGGRGRGKGGGRDTAWGRVCFGSGDRDPWKLV